MKHYKYEAPRGYFEQNEPTTDLDTYDYSSGNFGLLQRSYDSDIDVTASQWKRLEAHLEHLQATAEPGVKYKLFYWGRHGQGEHNVAEAHYGEDEWERYYCLDPAYFDARLTEIGEGQARHANTFLASQLKKGMPAPQSYYVSPQRRCLKTADLTWSSLTLPADRKFDPLIKEGIRERSGKHQCNKRSTKSEIHAAYPSWRIEDGFTENDEFWTPERESFESTLARLVKSLDQVFEHDENLIISFTAHGDAVRALLRGVGHNEGILATGSLIPVVVKATEIRN